VSGCGDQAVAMLDPSTTCCGSGRRPITLRRYSESDRMVSGVPWAAGELLAYRVSIRSLFAQALPAGQRFRSYVIRAESQDYPARTSSRLCCLSACLVARAYQAAHRSLRETIARGIDAEQRFNEGGREARGSGRGAEQKMSPGFGLPAPDIGRDQALRTKRPGDDVSVR